MNDHAPVPAWRKSSASNPHGNCVELAVLDSGRVGMRHSRDVHGAVLDYPPAALAAFLETVRHGAFDGIGRA